jgi:hypothetical protein
MFHYYYFFFNLRTAAFKAYCAIWVRHSNFRHQASPRVSPRESTQRRKVKLWARNVWKFCLNVDLHLTFRNLLHSVKLRHGTDGFISSPKKGVLRIFRPKNPTASAGCEPANLGTKGQHATSRPPKPLSKFHTQTHTYSAPPYKIQLPESCAACYTRQATKFHVFNTVIVQTVVFWVVSSGGLLREFLMFRRNMMPPFQGQDTWVTRRASLDHFDSEDTLVTMLAYPCIKDC